MPDATSLTIASRFLPKEKLIEVEHAIYYPGSDQYCELSSKHSAQVV